MKYAFIILHYCTFDMTVQAIESLKKLEKFEESAVIVVDNASNDQSGSKLKRKYQSLPNFHILLNKENLGFAKGNNCGYNYVRQKYSPDFIIFINSDILMIQKDFLHKIDEIYAGESFHVLGPDIITPEGTHQNPHRMKLFMYKDVKRIARNRSIILFYLQLKRKFHLENKIHFIEDWDNRRGLRERKEIIWKQPARDVVLHGSALIFSRDFISKEANAFYPGTFMWMEEEILSYLCSIKGYSTFYSPQLAVLHMGSKTVDNTFNFFEKYVFYSKCLKESASVLKQLMRDGES